MCQIIWSLFTTKRQTQTTERLPREKQKDHQETDKRQPRDNWETAERKPRDSRETAERQPRDRYTSKRQTETNKRLPR